MYIDLDITAVEGTPIWGASCLSIHTDLQLSFQPNGRDGGGTWHARATCADWDLEGVATADQPFTAALLAADALLKSGGELCLVQFEDGTTGVMPKSHLSEINLQ